MEMTPAASSPRGGNAPSGFLRELGWFLSGAVLPMGSLSFYRGAAKRSVGLAILFFFAFTLFITALTTINIVVTMTAVVNDIHQAYLQGQIPNITISHGIAQVDGPQPAILFDQRTGSDTILVAADTTGRMTEIDQRVYTQGLLLTRTELHILSSTEEYQRMSLSDLNAAFSTDPIVINEQTASNAWVALSAVIAVLAFIGLVLWNSIVRLMIIAMLALVLWGIVALFRPKVGFEPFIITGLYAIVPAIYISHLLSRSQFYFPGFQTILLLVFWAAALIGTLSDAKFFKAQNVSHLWTALLGLPMLLWLIVDIFAPLPSPAGEVVLWALVVLTMVALIGVRLYLHVTDMQASQQPALPQAPLPPSS